jgi:hypothetical protein
MAAQMDPTNPSDGISDVSADTPRSAALRQLATPEIARCAVAPTCGSLAFLVRLAS